MMRKSVNKNKIMSVIKDNKISRTTWHWCLDHIENLSLDNVSKNSKIVRLNLQELTKTLLHLCDVYMRTNQKKKILRKLQNQVTKMIKLIYVDVVDLIMLTAYNEFL